MDLNGLIGHQSLKSPVFFLQGSESPGRAHIHAPVLALPRIVGGIRDVVFCTHRLHRRAAFSFSQDPYHLLFAVSAFFHVVLFSFFPNRTSFFNCPVYGGQVTEDKIRILRQADAGQSIGEVCREHNLSEVSFHRWKKQFGQMEVNEAKRMKELERENTELKKMLADSLLENRVLKFVCEKKL